MLNPICHTKEEIKEALINLATYVVDYRESMLHATDKLSDKDKEILLNDFKFENREETIKKLWEHA